MLSTFLPLCRELELAQCKNLDASFLWNNVFSICYMYHCSCISATRENTKYGTIAKLPLKYRNFVSLSHVMNMCMTEIHVNSVLSTILVNVYCNAVYNNLIRWKSYWEILVGRKNESPPLLCSLCFGLMRLWIKIVENVFAAYFTIAPLNLT